MGRPKLEQTGVLYVRLPIRVIERIRREAKADRRAIAAYLRILIERSTEQQQESEESRTASASRV